MKASFDLPALSELGWTPHFHRQYLGLVSESSELENCVPARIVADHGSEFEIAGFGLPRRAVLTGRLAHELSGMRPCVGDFVLVSPRLDRGPLLIERLFERSSVFRRKVANATSNAQAIAANVDLAIVVAAFADEGADRHVVQRGLNARRIERYLVAVGEAPASAVVVITKADLRSDAAEQAALLRQELGTVDIVLTSALSGQGTDELAQRIGRGISAVLVGSSGAGKSSLVNRLLGKEAQRVEAVRDADTRGRHTTTHRELFVLPNGGLLIDTPGMRELALYADETTSLGKSGFDDIDAWAEQCRFRDCLHQGEPGCAVLEAVLRGELSATRLQHSEKLRRELEWQKQRVDAAERSAQRKKRRALSRAVRKGMRTKYGSE